MLYYSVMSDFTYLFVILQDMGMVVYNNEAIVKMFGQCVSGIDYIVTRNHISIPILSREVNSHIRSDIIAEYLTSVNYFYSEISRSGKHQIIYPIILAYIAPHRNIIDLAKKVGLEILQNINPSELTQEIIKYVMRYTMPEFNKI